MKNKIVIKERTIEISYQFPNMLNGRSFEDFMGWLGDADVVTAFELGEPFLCATGILYTFTDSECEYLLRYGKVKLYKVDTLENYVRRNNTPPNMDYYNWYYNLD